MYEMNGTVILISLNVSEAYHDIGMNTVMRIQKEVGIKGLIVYCVVDLSDMNQVKAFVSEYKYDRCDYLINEAASYNVGV